MGILFDLYKLKVKIFLGAIRASKASMLLLAIYIIGIAPSSIGMSMIIVDAVKGGIDLLVYLDALAALISGIFAMILLSTLRGFVVFEYEQSLIFTSPITPRQFLIISLFADITVFTVFFFPLFLLLAIVIVNLTLPVLSALSIVTSTLILAFILFFIKASFSILESVRSSSVFKILTIVLIGLLLLPVTGLFTALPLRYRELPYPSTFIAEMFLNVLYGRLPPVDAVLGATLYVLGSLLLFIYCSRLNLFQFARAVPFISPFDTSMRTQEVKMGSNIKLFSKVGLKFTLDLGSESLLKFLMKKEFIRMVRDGSLFGVLMLYLIISVMTVITSSSEAPFPIWMLVLAIYSFIVPAMLISNWRIGELDNLWLPLTSGLSFELISKALLYDFTIIAFTIPAATIIILTLAGQIEPLVPFVLVTSVSMVGCSTNLYMMMHFLSKKRRAIPSLMISWTSMLLFGLFILPAYIYVLLSYLFGLSTEILVVLSVFIVLYSVLVFRFFSGRIERKALSVEL